MSKIQKKTNKKKKKNSSNVLKIIAGISILEKIMVKHCVFVVIQKLPIPAILLEAIISEKNGGEINVDNIIPICSDCNSSMGYTNMDKFITKYYPENIKNFNEKKYTLK